MIATPVLIAVLIASAVAVAIFRVLRSMHRWRRLLALGQVLAGALLYLLLFPPQAPETGATLTILTPGVTSEQLAATGTGAQVIALPDIAIKVDGRIERAPDLATALRRYPQTSSVHVIGNGLPSRDRQTARRIAVKFDAAPLPDGFVELSMPDHVQVGNRWRVSGRIQATPLANHAIELHDPAEGVAASVRTDAQGRFTVEGAARASGLLRYSLRALDEDGKPIDQVPLSIDARADAPLRLLMMAAVPSPELKYLRRWATDAGQIVDSRIGLSDGIALRDAEQPLIDATSLAASDLLIVDERSWAALDATTRERITGAVDSGLGLLLRVTGPITNEDLDAWGELGVTITAADPVAPSPLRDDTREDALALTHLPYRLGADMAPLAAARNGDVVIGWRAQGQGRIGVIILADTYRYVLTGTPDRHGSLWSSITSILGRARGNSQPRLPSFARVGERAVICNLGESGWHIEDPSRVRTALLPDEGSDGCAAYWPSMTGAHHLSRNNEPATTEPPSASGSFDVLADGQAATLLAAQTQRATQNLATQPTTVAATADRIAHIPRVVWLLAWLCVMTLLWWVERRDYQINHD